MSEKVNEFTGSGKVYYCTLDKKFVQTFALDAHTTVPRYGESITLKGVEFQVYNVAYVPYRIPSCGLYEMQVFVWITPLPIKKDC